MIEMNQALPAIGIFVGILLIAGMVVLAISVRRNRRRSRNSMPQYGGKRTKTSRRKQR